MYNAEAPSLEMKTKMEELIKMYTQMTIIRRIETAFWWSLQESKKTVVLLFIYWRGLFKLFALK